MVEQTMSLVCRRCKSDPVLVRQKRPSDALRCPKCKVTGDKNKVIKAAREYHARNAYHSVIKDLQQGLRSSTAGLKHVTYKPGKLPKLKPPDFIYVK